MSGPRAAVIGLIVAMPSELRHLLDQATVEREAAAGPWADLHLALAGRRLVAVCSGIGMVNAAAATEHLIESHQPGAMLNVGCAGAHRRDILPGDVVIGTGTVSHGAVHILPSGEDFFPRPDAPMPGDVVRETTSDPALLAAARAAAADWTPSPWPATLGWPAAVPRRGPAVHTGIVASADTWTQAHARLDQLHARHQSLAEDMEAAAVAQICRRHQVPFLTIKDISNNEFLAASTLTGGEAETLPWDEVGRRSTELLVRVIQRLSH